MLGLRVLGWSFIVRSGVASLSFSAFYAILERFPRLWTGIAEMPLLAAVVGAIFVGGGVGICVLAGGAPGGDDALAMSVGKLLHCNVQWVYLAADIVVLLASLSYIPLRRIAYSLLTVVLSGAIIGQLQRMFMKDAPDAPAAAEPAVMNAHHGRLVIFSLSMPGLISYSDRDCGRRRSCRRCQFPCCDTSCCIVDIYIVFGDGLTYDKNFSGNAVCIS